MRVRPLPKAWLIHTVIYEGFTGKKDSYGNPKYDNPITIKNVRFDDSTVFSRDSMETKILANAVIFVDSKNSENVPKKFVEQSKITFKDKSYTLKKVVDCYYPDKDEIHHYELEVI